MEEGGFEVPADPGDPRTSLPSLDRSTSMDGSPRTPPSSSAHHRCSTVFRSRSPSMFHKSTSAHPSHLQVDFRFVETLVINALPLFSEEGGGRFARVDIGDIFTPTFFHVPAYRLFLDVSFKSRIIRNPDDHVPNRASEDKIFGSLVPEVSNNPPKKSHCFFFQSGFAASQRTLLIKRS